MLPISLELEILGRVACTRITARLKICDYLCGINHKELFIYADQ